MTIKRGNVVSHSGATQWGAGKVIEVTEMRATIQFSDGIVRKIVSSHYGVLQPANPASFVPIAEGIPVVKVRAAAKRVKKAAA
jgi:hypothetical protein